MWLFEARSYLSQIRGEDSRRKESIFQGEGTEQSCQLSAILGSGGQHCIEEIVQQETQLVRKEVSALKGCFHCGKMLSLQVLPAVSRMICDSGLPKILFFFSLCIQPFLVKLVYFYKKIFFVIVILSFWNQEGFLLESNNVSLFLLSNVGFLGSAFWS